MKPFFQRSTLFSVIKLIISKRTAPDQPAVVKTQKPPSKRARIRRVRTRSYLPRQSALFHRRLQPTPHSRKSGTACQTQLILHERDRAPASRGATSAEKTPRKSLFSARTTRGKAPPRSLHVPATVDVPTW